MTLAFGWWLHHFSTESLLFVPLWSQPLVGSLHFFVLDCFFHTSSFCKELNQNTASDFFLNFANMYNMYIWLLFLILFQTLELNNWNAVLASSHDTYWNQCRSVFYSHPRINSDYWWFISCLNSSITLKGKQSLFSTKTYQCHLIYCHGGEYKHLVFIFLISHNSWERNDKGQTAEANDLHLISMRLYVDDQCYSSSLSLFTSLWNI